MQAIPEDYPVTGLCIISDPTKCPPGYHVIYRSHDKQDDCDLWKDSFFRSKVTRYLCFTRQYPLDKGKLNNVLADIVINNEKDMAPPGYSLIDVTIDSRDKATRKRQICVQMLPRATTRDAVCDIVFLSKTRRAPTGYTLAGEINGLLLCFKMNSVPPETPNGIIETNSVPLHSALPPTLPPINMAHSQGSSGMDPSYSPVRRQESLIVPSSCLHGVPFKLSGHLQSAGNIKSVRVPEIHYRSYVDIDTEYSYPFRLEQSALQDS